MAERPAATTQSSGASIGSASSGDSDIVSADAGFLMADLDEGSPTTAPIGQIHLPGQPIVASSQHRALERYKLWEKANQQYLAGVDMRTRWDYYIQNKDGKQLAELTKNHQGLGLAK